VFTKALSVLGILDESNAVDRTKQKQNLLITKLLMLSVHMCIVRLMVSWHKNQIVKRGIYLSYPFTVTRRATRRGHLGHFPPRNFQKSA